MDFFWLFSDYTFLVVAAGAALLGITGGVAGAFAVLKKQSLLGDAVSHSALPGIALAFIVTGQKDTVFLMAGALVFGIIAAVLIAGVVKNSVIDYGTALAVVMSVLFGLGMALLSYIQKQPNANQAGIERFIFGQASSMLIGDVYFLAGSAAVVVTAAALFWKEFKITAFDPVYAKSIGYNTLLIDLIITSLIILAVVSGLSLTGVILMSALLIAPASAARQWSDKMGTVVVLSAVIGAVSGVVGTAVSSLADNIPTGPAIVVTVSAVVFVSLLFSPSRGIAVKAVRRMRLKRELKDKGGKQNV